MKICKGAYPETQNIGGDHEVACWLLHEKAGKVGKPTWIGGNQNGTEG